MNRIRKSLAIAALGGGSLLGAFFGTAVVQNTRFAHAAEQVKASRDQLEHMEGLATVFREIGKVVEPSVVNITVRKSAGAGQRALPFDDEMLRRFFPDNDGDGQPDIPEGFGQGRGGDGEEFGLRGTGSGVIMEANGSTAFVLTNNHVAGGASEIQITLADGRVIENGKVLGTDAKTDLAVIKIEADRLIPAKWGDSDELQKGDWIMAFGSPFGYVGSMTHGIVSALNRQAGILGQHGYESFIQVDAPINPGNSGGPLVNTHGEVVGINTAIATRNGGFQGIGFAIPSNQAKFVYAQLKEKGKVTRGWLGVSIRDVAADATAIQQTFHYKGTDGVMVHELLSGAPVQGKLQRGDIITEMNGKTVKNVQELRNAVAAAAPGSDLKLKVFRDNKLQDVTIKLGEQPENLDQVAMRGGRGPGAVGGGSAEASAELRGMSLSNPTDELAQKFGLTADMRKGAVVTDVKPRSAAFKAGIRPGDVISEVAGKPVANAKEAADAIGKQDKEKILLLYVTSNAAGGSRFVFVEPQK